jgi:transporter family-2 protein
MIGTYWPHLVAIGVGVGLTAQVGMNMALGRAMHSPLAATVVNFAVGLAALIACAIAVGVRWNTTAAMQAPAWSWAGGLLGATYVVSVTTLGPRLGALALFTLVLAGQLGAALIVDRYGVLGFPRAEITPLRLVGAGLVVAGVLLVLRR